MAGYARYAGEGIPPLRLHARAYPFHIPLLLEDKMNLSPELQEMLIQVCVGLLVAFAGSETLPFIKKVKSNGLVQLVWNVVKGLARK